MLVASTVSALIWALKFTTGQLTVIIADEMVAVLQSIWRLAAAWISIPSSFD